MNIHEVRRMQAEKDHLMRTEGKHPANHSKAELDAVERLPEHIRSNRDVKLYRRALTPFMNEDESEGNLP